jgi:hypothetical protein
VYKAAAEPWSEAIAYKKSRVPLHVRRTTFCHEAWVMQLLQGHPAILKLFGYHREEHFEYLGIELLGEDLKAMIQPGAWALPETWNGSEDMGNRWYTRTTPLICMIDKLIMLSVIQSSGKTVTVWRGIARYRENGS